MHEEIAEQQADITRLLLHHVQVPLAGAQYIRGILPAPVPAEAIRLVTGAEAAYTRDQLTAYEIPLRTDAGLLTADGIVGPSPKSVRTRACADSSSWVRTGCVSTSTRRASLG
ncbi:hypothetical protein AB0H03_03770 [Streptomyces sparsogenes]|uniref:hypothetical protein n=1 Tax=Streptomyces sparsogenes TaxID=67365 RepID=UPI0033FD6899